MLVLLSTLDRMSKDLYCFLSVLCQTGKIHKILRRYHVASHI